MAFEQITFAILIVTIYIGIIRLFDRLNSKSRTNIAITINALLSLILYNYLTFFPSNQHDIPKKEIIKSKSLISSINSINENNNALFQTSKLSLLLIPLIVSKYFTGDWYNGTIDYTVITWLIIVSILFISFHISLLSLLSCHLYYY